MVQRYKPYSKEWWTERRIELYRLFSEGHNIAYMKKMLDDKGKRLFPGNKELSNVKKAFDNQDDPFAESTPLADTEADGSGGNGSGGSNEGKPKVIPPLRGPSFIASVKPRVVTLDPRLFILYDLTKAVFPEYERDEGQWISESIIGFYSEHSDEFELGRLFIQVEEGEHDNRETARVDGTTPKEGKDEA